MHRFEAQPRHVPLGTQVSLQACAARTFKTQPVCAPAPLPPEMRAAERTCPSQTADYLRAVSYTHLRAHETSAHL
eukprot:8910083-Alexandrium_andersonii.AAC.1